MLSLDDVSRSFLTTAGQSLRDETTPHQMNLYIAFI